MNSIDFLGKLLKDNNLTETDLAKKLDIKPQSINGWKVSGEIPTKRISQISEIFSLSNRDTDLLLGNTPLDFEFRTTSGEDLPANGASDKIKVRAEVIFERFFQGFEKPKDYDLSTLREKIQNIGNNFFEIAQAIRDEFVIPSYRPFAFNDTGNIMEHIKIKSFYLPFEAVGLGRSEESNQTAVLYSKGEHYVILIDSDRRLDEAHFDHIHEFLHIIFHGIKFKIDHDSLEKLIDKVAGELIYPKEYVLERYFNGNKDSRPITDKTSLTEKFWKDSRNCIYSISPKGLAKAMRDSELTTENSELYKYLSLELHCEFTEECITCSEFGKMDIDFKDPKKVLEFYEHAGSILKKERYPLFDKIKTDLLSDRLNVADFADTFAMKLADAMLLKALWTQREKASVTK